MVKNAKDDPVLETHLDPRLAYPRLKEGLVTPDTGIFLRIEEGNGAGRVYTLSSGGAYLIGRDGADIVVEDSKVSRKHADLTLLGPEAYFIRDLASTNGTFVNGRRVTEKRKLIHEDRIRVGDTVFHLSVIDDSIPME
jgi:pSer/pThr/pTyr-binding forkhead associated (FHA) protein